MEPENTPLEKENHLRNHHFQVRTVSLPEGRYLTKLESDEFVLGVLHCTINVVSNVFFHG